MMTIRPATREDAPALARLNADFNGVVEPPEALAGRMAQLAGLETALLAEIDGRAAGFACLRIVACLCSPEPHAELTELYVDPAHRRRGVARALIARAEQLARAGGATELMLLTGSHNDAAQAVYRAAGFADDDPSMRKDLGCDTGAR